MNESLTVYSPETKQVTARDIRAQVNMIQEVMKSVMKNGTHYGTIPGTPKPTLFKPGAEKILMTFQLVCGDPNISDLSVPDEARYRVVVPVLTRAGVLVGSGCGECSSSEEKYRWRKPVCPEEFDETPEDRKRVKWFKGREGAKPYQQKQVRMQPVDVANTILKMAHKRALIAATLVTTAASDVFDQDIEDLPEGMETHTPPREPVKMPTAKTATPPADTPPPAANGQTVTGLVEAITSKPGTKKNGQAYTRYGIKLGEAWYNSFDSAVYDTAREAKDAGAPVRIVYDVNARGYNDILSIEPDLAADDAAVVEELDGKLPF
jgi:hypothetical protein